MPLRVLILGAGFGGLEVAARLSEEVADEVEVTLIDKNDSFVFGFSKLDVMFGKVAEEHVRHSYSDVIKPGVTFVQTIIRSIDPVARSVETDVGKFSADVLLIALGADLHPEATPGLVEGGYEFYTVAGAFALRAVLTDFRGGKVVVAVTSTPFKCPPAPSETALLLHEFLGARGLLGVSEISLVLPMGVPVPPSPQASAALVAAFEERGINWLPDRRVRGLDSTRKVVLLSDGTELPYDLFLGVPVHTAPEVVTASSLAVDGWIPVDPKTLETAFPDVYAVGDVTSVGTPKAGVFAEGQALVVADRIIARVRGTGPGAEYDGRGICYLEFGDTEVAKVDVTFRPGQRPHGDLAGPSFDLAAEKIEFGRSRIRRWFGHDWRPTL